jgi:hypothetical protein
MQALLANGQALTHDWLVLVLGKEKYPRNLQQNFAHVSVYRRESYDIA